MASRYTAPSGLVKPGRRVSVCLTCGRRKIISGHLGALQRDFACSQECYNTYRRFSATRTFASQGLGYAAGITPITPGGKSI